MRMMDLTYPAGALTPDAKDELVDELTTVLLRAERAPDAQFFRDNARERETAGQTAAALSS
jgi:hypothetical protein